MHASPYAAVAAARSHDHNRLGHTKFAAQQSTWPTTVETTDKRQKIQARLLDLVD